MECGAKTLPVKKTTKKISREMLG